MKAQNNYLFNQHPCKLSPLHQRAFLMCSGPPLLYYPMHNHMVGLPPLLLILLLQTHYIYKTLIRMGTSPLLVCTGSFLICVDFLTTCASLLLTWVGQKPLAGVPKKEKLWWLLQPSWPYLYHGGLFHNHVGFIFLAFAGPTPCFQCHWGKLLG